MKRRILGFQRRVWCPKCTPESSSSCKVTRATFFSFRSVTQSPWCTASGDRTKPRRHFFNSPTVGEPDHDSRWRRLPPRVGLAVDLLESRFRDVRVELRGREALVTEQFLHDAQIRAALEQMRGVGVAQRVRMDVTARDAIIEDTSNVTRAQAVTPTVEEQCVTR